MKQEQKKYWNFSEDGRELIINSPDIPRSCRNYLTNDLYGLKFGQNGVGFSSYPILEGRHINKSIEEDRGGRCIYVKDNESQELWNVNFQPVRNNLDFFNCRHGLGYSIIKSGFDGIEHSFEIFVAASDPVELWTLTFKNESSRCRELTIYPYIEWFLGSGTALWDDPRWYTKTKYSDEDKTITATFFNPTKVGENYSAFIKALFVPDGYCCSKRIFCGANGRIENPDGVQENLQCPLAKGEIGTGVFEKKIKLAPGETCQLHLLLGCVDSNIKQDDIVSKFMRPEQFNAELQTVQNFWNKIVDKHNISTPDPSFDRWINIWLKYQEFQCFRWAGLGEPNAPLMGYRDVLQHVLAMALFAPQMARARIVEALSHQYSNGRAVRQWSRHGGHDRRDYRDSPVWIIFALCTYLKETGDFKLLEEKVPYIDNGGCDYVIRHVEIALENLYNDRGENGLSHIGEGDWFDPLNKIGTKGRGESVWLSMAVISAFEEMAELYVHINQPDKTEQCRSRKEIMTEAVNANAWDGEWYLRAYTDSGEKIGSHECEEGKIFANPQIWAIISGVAGGERLDYCIKSLEYNLKSKFGYAICKPPYTEKNIHLGNVGLLQGCSHAYSHVSGFKMYADCLRGDGSAALETFKLIDPSSITHPPEITMADPHIIPNGYKTTSNDPEEGLVFNSGSSGTFPWILKTAIEQMLGAKAGYDALYIAPCLPSEWKHASIKREYRGAVYNIEIYNPDGISDGEVELVIDGKPCNGNRIENFADGKIHYITCNIVTKQR
jgi:cellobiose phosphorylase